MFASNLDSGVDPRIKCTNTIMIQLMKEIASAINYRILTL